MRLARRNVSYHRCTTADHGPFTDPNTFLHHRVRADKRPVANLHTATQDGARGDVTPRTEHAAMIDKRPGVDDDAVTDHHAGVHNSVCRDEDTLAVVGTRCNNSLGMNHIDIATKTLPNPVIANGDDEVVSRPRTGTLSVIAKLA